MSDGLNNQTSDTGGNATELCYTVLNATLPPYQSVQFDDPDHVVRVHYDSPRFGHTRDIDVLIKDPRGDGKDYVKGLISSSIAIAVATVVWCLVLLFLRLLGPSRVGMMSGRLPERPQQSKDPNEMESEGSKRMPEPFGQQQAVVEEEGNESGNDPTPPGLFGDAPNDDLAKSENSQPGADTLLEETSALSVNKDSLDGGLCDECSAGSFGAGGEPCKEEAESGGEQNVERDGHIDEDVGSPSTNKSNQKAARRLRNARIVVLLCGLGIVLSVIVASSVGVPSFVDALSAGHSSLQQGESLALNGANLIDTFLIRLNSTTEGVQQLASNTTNATSICPLLVQEYCLDDATGQTRDGCNLAEIEGNLTLILSTLGGNLVQRLNKIGIDLENVASELQRIDNKAYDWAFAVAYVFSVVEALLAIVVCYGIILVWKGEIKQVRFHCMRRCMRSWLLVPSFAVFTFLSFLFTLVFVIGSIAASDFCVDSPDPRVTLVIQESQQFFSSDFIYGLSLFYVNGCPTGDVPPLLEVLSDSITLLAETVVNLSLALDKLDSDEYQQFCDADTSVLVYSAEAAACLLAATMAEIETYFSCANWRPLYESVIYTAVCYEGSEGLYFVSITQFMVVIFAMVMLTLRASFLVAPPAVEAEESGSSAAPVLDGEESSHVEQPDSGVQESDEEHPTT